VLPTVVSIPDYKSAEELEALAGIGKASAGRLTFAQYATGLAEVFVPANLRDNPRLLKVLAPAMPMKDDDETVYIFRLTAADPSHKPSDPTEVLAKLREDVITATAYAKARAAAEELLKSAKASGLDSAAQSAKRTVITAGPFRGMGEAIPNYPSGRRAGAAGVHGRGDEATQAGRVRPASAGADRLPQDGKVLVARLADVKPAWDGDTQYMVEMQLNQQMTSELERLLQNDWYSYPALVARLNYQPESSGRSKSSSDQPTPGPAPAPTPLGL
jgi:DNA uptake protein ComE-like DNA-binding protein